MVVVIVEPDGWWVVGQVVLGSLQIVVGVVIVDLAVERIPSSLPKQLMLMPLQIATHVADADEHVQELGHQDEHYGSKEGVLYFVPVV